MGHFWHHLFDGLLLHLFVSLVQLLILKGLLISFLDVSFEVRYGGLLRRNQILQPFWFCLVLVAKHWDLLVQVAYLADVLLMQLAHFAEHLHLHLLTLLHAIFTLFLKNPWEFLDLSILQPDLSLQILNLLVKLRRCRISWSSDIFKQMIKMILLFLFFDPMLLK